MSPLPFNRRKSSNVLLMLSYSRKYIYLVNKKEPEWEKLNGELGTLIGIDNDEAVVQLTATTEVNIIPKRFIVIYIDT